MPPRRTTGSACFARCARVFHNLKFSRVFSPNFLGENRRIQADASQQLCSHFCTEFDGRPQCVAASRRSSSDHEQPLTSDSALLCCVAESLESYVELNHTNFCVDSTGYLRRMMGLVNFAGTPSLDFAAFLSS